MKTIILTGGGTAGHCTPHFALVNLLKNHFDKIFYIGSETGIEKSIVEKTDIKYYSIPTVKLKRSFDLQNAKIPFLLIKSVNKAKKLLKELKPDVVFSKGGFVGLPVTIASKKLGIPVIIHESDLSVGLANKIASKFSKLTLTSFEDTANKLKNGLFVGSPIRDELFKGDREKSLKLYNLSPTKPTLLITGGSSGAKALNEIVTENVDYLLEKFNVLHLVGKGNLSNVFRKNYCQVEFTDMKNAYAVADVCLSRAGSNTFFELIALKIPTLAVPLPKLESRGDQIENAEYFYKKGLIRYIPQENLTNKTFRHEINKLYLERPLIYKNLKTQNLSSANEKICEILCKY